MKKNIGNTDKLVRIIIALIAAYFAWKGGFDAAWKEYTLWAVSIIMLLTSLIGTCPIWLITDFNTIKDKK